MIAAEPIVLESYLAGKWVRGDGEGAALVDPATGETVARASSDGLDLAGALRYAREIGGPALRRLSFAERAELLGKIADVLAARKDEWHEIARRNSGNTPADAAIDVDGAIGTLKYFAKTGAALGSASFLADGGPQRLARDANFQGLHIGVPIDGVAIHINAYNFPSWGLWEKAAVALLAGVPVVAKPATATAWLAVAMTRAVTDAGILPDGALSIIAGSAGDLLLFVKFGDALAFTGSSETGETIREHPHVRGENIRVNVEADSLNASLLGPDAAPGTPVFDLFVREVVREMTTKAGQKCTAIRRALVPAAFADAVVAAISSALDAAPEVAPVVSPSSRDAVEAGIRALQEAATLVYRRRHGADEKAAYVAPALFRADGDVPVVHDAEIFGPVATVVTYRDPAEAYALARRGGGSLVASVFSADPAFLAASAAALGASHGRVLLVDPSIGESHTGHGIVLPSCLHGGPGRAGNGEELGGLRGLWFYHQRTAVQGPAPVLAELASRAVEIAR
jgi:3,4-dehydroadipyl-CoA semialdehyde dehydrogenase